MCGEPYDEKQPLCIAQVGAKRIGGDSMEGSIFLQYIQYTHTYL
uniref:Uncharacterized protein n=1 Tax=Anguilla anguilla TaxID=7936 RepID=A0A0E9RP04_ANGAN